MLCSDRLFAPQRATWTRGRAGRVVVPSADDVDGVVDELLPPGQPPAVLVGLSLGGIAALAAAVAAPERVAALVLLSTSARPPRPDQLQGWDHLEARTRAGHPVTETARELVPALVHPHRCHDAALVTTLVDMAADVGPATLLRQLDVQRSRRDLRPDLGLVACPTLVVAAEHDALVPDEVHREVCAGVRGAQLALVPGSGHLPTLERPAHVRDLVATWLEIHAPVTTTA